jgi:hypothetical protein
MKFVVIPALILTVASLMVIGGAAFALFLFFPLFVLGLLRVFIDVGDRTVTQRNPSTDARRWRNGS